MSVNWPTSLTNSYFGTLAENVSGCRAVSVQSGGTFVTAQANSGLRMPSIGLVVDDLSSGSTVQVVRGGSFSLSSGLGLNWSGFQGLLYVGSGGLLVPYSLVLSGAFIQSVGTALPDNSVLIDISPVYESFSSGILPVGSIGSGAIQLGSIGSGHLASGLISNIATILSGQIVGQLLANQSVTSGTIASGSISVLHLVSGLQVSGIVNSGGIASGQIGFGHIANASVQSGSVASGQLGIIHFQSGLTVSGLNLSGSLGSGQIGLFHLQSGLQISGIVNSGGIASGQIGTTHVANAGVLSGNIGSGQLSLFHCVSGMQISGIVNSGGIASGQVGFGHIANAGVQSGSIGSGQIGLFHHVSGMQISGVINSGGIASGQIGTTHLANAAVNSGNIGSGQISVFHHVSGFQISGVINSGGMASGQIGFGHLANASVQSGTIASGQIGQFHHASGSVQSGQIASGVPITYARNVFDDTMTAGQAISGNRAVALNSGGSSVVPAEYASGLRLPAIGVSITNAASGGSVTFVRFGKIFQAASGCLPSGFVGSYAYVGSGGLIINLSGFNATGTGPNPSVAAVSGILVQRIGLVMSGPSLYVNPDPFPNSGLISGSLLGF